MTSAAASGAPLTDGVTHTTIDNPDQNDKARAYINRLSEVAGTTIVLYNKKPKLLIGSFIGLLIFLYFADPTCEGA